MVFHKILKEKRKQIAKTKKLAPLESLKKQLSSRSQRKKHAFAKALSAKNRLHLICELKKASPSAGLLKRDFIPTHLAREFQKAGASAISVLTEEHYFEGRLSTIREIRSVTHLPILRKDFIIEPYQIYETAAAGADAFLLITSLLKKSKLSSMIRLGYSLGLDALVEVHTRKELGIALKSGARIIGLNNRNLKTLKVNRSHAEKLLPYVSRKVTVVVESGIKNRGDILRYQSRGINCFLIGTVLMRSSNIKTKIRELLGEGC